MTIDIDRLTESELIDLNHRIVERLRFLSSMHAHAEMMEFSIGERVAFNPAGREEQRGVLVKYNKKTVTVVTEAGQRWNVSPHLLQKLKNTKPESGKRDNVIDIRERS
ncbi:MAG: hypothetical protein ACE5D4_00295 [Thermodesulfobacteriota bacterium]